MENHKELLGQEITSMAKYNALPAEIKAVSGRHAIIRALHAK
jgi:hypothetical protein